jgi:multiple sugar transport system permease protein
VRAARPIHAAKAASLGRSLSRRENVEGWLFASPWIIGFVVFTAGPMVASAVLAFTRWDLISEPQWAGLANFRRLFVTDPLALHALKVTTVYAAVSVPLHIAGGVAVALLLNANVRGQQWYRTIYYLPAVLSGVAVALLWRWVFSPDFGLMNYVLSLVGITGPMWLADPAWAMPSLVIMSLWHLGAGMVIYLAGLQGIPTELYEAAEVDGANGWHRFWRITLPLMSPVIFFQLIIGVIRSLQVFTEAYVLTSGGPRDATLFYMLYLYQNAFQFFRMGYAAALAWVLFFYILVLTLLMFRGSQLWVHYEGALRPRRR